MVFDMRNIPSGKTLSLLILLDGLICRRVVAFDTVECWVEELAGAGSAVIPFRGLNDWPSPKYGNYNGLATERRGGVVEVYRPVHDQTEMDELANQVERPV
jgi:hypothetical protein